MRYLSVCSGIEAATHAWHPLGWEPVAFSEVEPFPSAVLAHHYPSVPNLGDMTKYKEWPDAAIDLLVGGTPCQSFSVAGLRKGLADPRGNLMLTYGAIAARYRPAWLVWENVPGVLSSNGGRDFGTFLGMLGELGYGFAYRVLDAQFFGVAQRRRRVFVVGHLGDWRRAAAVLFERHSLQGHPAPSREAGEGASVSPCLRARANSSHRVDTQSYVADVARCVTTGEGKRQDYETCTLVAHSLRGEGFDASEDGTGRGTPLVLVAFAQNTRDEVRMVGGDGSIAGALAAEPGALRENPASGPDGVGIQAEHAYTLEARSEVQAIAFDCKASGQNGFGVGEIASTMRSMGHSNSHQNGGGHQAVMAGMQVRRLTPVECERLQGFPDDYTNIPWRGKPESPDGPRYKALGNSMAVPCMVWLGERIQMVEQVAKTEAAA